MASGSGGFGDPFHIVATVGEPATITVFSTPFFYGPSTNPTLAGVAFGVLKDVGATCVNDCLIQSTMVSTRRVGYWSFRLSCLHALVAPICTYSRDLREQRPWPLLQTLRCSPMPRP